jgi:flagellar basal-body rod protein FlgF
MDRMIYTAMTGARYSLDQQAVVSNNMANAATPGFRAQMQAMLAEPVVGAGLPTRSLTVASTPMADLTVGPVSSTGRDLDVAMRGDAWLAIQAPDGSEAYTRRGDLQVDANGMITVAGRPVIGEGGPMIVPVDSTLSVGADGTVSAIGPGLTPENISPVGRLKLVTAAPGALQRGEDGLFRTVPDAKGVTAPLPADDNARLASGALEGSNVSPTEAMVAMIDNARRYEMQMKVISDASENTQRANSLLSLQG